MEKFFSIKPLGAQLQAGQRVLKAADYQQILTYEQHLQQLELRYRQREKVAAVALAKSIQRGLEEGQERANRQAAEQMVLFAGRVNDTLARIEDELVEVVTAAVRKVILGVDQEERVRNAVQAGLELVRGSHKLLVRVHPQQQAVVAAQLDAIQHRFTNLEVVGDQELKLDDCILESDLGIVNAGVGQQLLVIEQALRMAFSRREPS
ncbi:type III secretion system stator protein SctL [Candidatus Thiothrix anitrata]|jgi:type III secretion protein L|uniref:Type 3 secretion system stator protein n=1 Tax=Candidatus Thiothrix anitrata TaxID=2823902 RepID=A0ABX7X5I9_9GAMM|nr:type III secretion system stator protein SctL [Candidatus Thiothrix anitrata]QTR51140.1 type III secretion system stator protein SctL [Candidatus Thiothrix anitrata]